MSESYDISGVVAKVGEVQQISDSFKKRELWIDTDSKYKNQLCIEFKQDGCVHLDDVSVGDNVKCCVNIEGNEHNGRRYTSLGGWKIQNLSANDSAPPPPSGDDGPIDEFDDGSEIPF